MARSWPPSCEGALVRLPALRRPVFRPGGSSSVEREPDVAELVSDVVSARKPNNAKSAPLSYQHHRRRMRMAPPAPGPAPSFATRRARCSTCCGRGRRAGHAAVDSARPRPNKFSEARCEKGSLRGLPRCRSSGSPTPSCDRSVRVSSLRIASQAVCYSSVTGRLSFWYTDRAPSI